MLCFPIKLINSILLFPTCTLFISFIMTSLDCIVFKNSWSLFNKREQALEGEITLSLASHNAKLKDKHSSVFSVTVLVIKTWISVF